MTRKILVLCTLEHDLVAKYQGSIEYCPQSNDETDRSWNSLIEHYRPQAIVFGLQTIDEPKLAFWRQRQPQERLQFVRKGTSLHRVDFAAAKKYNIEIHNTAGVNAAYVADFIVARIGQQEPIGIVGVGAIGKKVASALLAQNKSILLYNRTKCDIGGTYVDDLGDLFTQAAAISVCLPLTEQTTGIITAQHILAMPENAKIICISPPRVMSREAVVALDKRKDLDVTFDHVASGLAFIHEALGRTNLRKNFVFEEKAAAGHDCQYAMGEAAICKAGM